MKKKKGSEQGPLKGVAIEKIMKIKRAILFFSWFYTIKALAIFGIETHELCLLSHDKEGITRKTYASYAVSEFPLIVCIDTHLIPKGSWAYDQVDYSMHLWNVVNEKRQRELVQSGVIDSQEYHNKLPPFELFRFYSDNGCGYLFGRFHIKVKTKGFDGKWFGQANVTGQKRTVWIDKNFVKTSANVLWKHINPYSIIEKVASGPNENSFLYSTLVHEFGHALGLPHNRWNYYEMGHCL